MTREGTGRRGLDPKCADEDWVEAFLSDVKDGLQPYLAAELHGISRITFYKWWRLGGGASVVDHPEFVHPEDAEEPYASFVRRTTQAEIGVIGEITKVVTQKAKSDAEFGLKVLKSRQSQDWNPNRTPSPMVDVSEGAAQTVILSLADFDRLRERNNDEGADDSDSPVQRA